MRAFVENYPYGSNRGSITPQPPDWVDARVLAIATAERHTIPSGANFVSFSANGDFYALFGGSGVTAAIPGSDVIDGTASEMNPMARKIPSGATHISLIAPAATIVTLSFWS